MLSPEMQRRLILILADDLGKGDVTSALLKNQNCKAVIVTEQDCTVAGVEEAAFLFRTNLVKVKATVMDGNDIEKGRTLLKLEGLNKRILQVERTALNVLSRMSAVATACAKARKIAKKYNVKIALTRKTSPGFNVFDKKAATLVKALPHRHNLGEMVLIKDNHLKFFESAYEAVMTARAKQHLHKKQIEIEVETLKQAIAASKAKPDYIMLDNFSVKRAKHAMAEIRKINKKVKIELSGGITPRNLKNYAKLRPYMISMGYLTQKVKGIDFSLDII